MSRKIDIDHSQCLSAQSTFLTGVPITISTWFKPSSLAGQGSLVTLSHATTNNGYSMSWEGSLTGNSGLYIRAQSFDISSSVVCYSPKKSTAITEWSHGAAVYNSNSSRTAYIDGASASNSTTTSPSGIHQICIGQFSPGRSTPITTDIFLSDVALWNVGLSNSEIIKLSEGISPLLIRPSSLVAYYPFVGKNEDYEFSIVDGGPLLINSGTTIGHGNDFRLYKNYGPTVELTQTRAGGSLDLFLQCGETVTSCELPYTSGGGFTTGFDWGFEGGLLYGCPPGWHLNLFMEGHNPFPTGIDDGSVDMFLPGHTVSSSGIDFFIPGLTFPDENPYGYINLFVQTKELVPTSGNLDFYMWSTQHSGLYNDIDFYVEASQTGIEHTYINMFIPQTDGEQITDYINMFLKGIGNDNGTITTYNNIDFTIVNNFNSSSSGINMYLEAPSGTLGAIPFSGDINFVVWRDSESLHHNIQFFLPGPSGLEQGLNLYLDAQPKASSGIDMYMLATDTISDGIELFSTGF